MLVLDMNGTIKDDRGCGGLLTVIFFRNYVRLCSRMSMQFALQYREQIVSKHAIGLGRLCLIREGLSDT